MIALHRRNLTRAHPAVVAGLLLLVLVFATLTPTMGGPIVRTLGSLDSPASVVGTGAAPTAPATPAPGTIVPAGNCTGPDVVFSTTLALVGPLGNASSDAATWTIGPAPLNVSFNLSITGPQTVYSYTIVWGDGTTLNGNVTMPVANSVSLNLTHFYAFPGWFFFSWLVNWHCKYGGGPGGGNDQLTVFGPAGPHPVTVTTNVTFATVPASVTYSLVVVGAPTNSTAEWDVSSQDPGIRLQFADTAVIGNASAEAFNLTVPSVYHGAVEIAWGSPSLAYAFVDLPNVTINPQVWLRLAYTPAVGFSPWNLTFWGNVTTLADTLYTGNGSVGWQFSPGSVGPTNGSPVWQEFFDNYSQGVYYVDALDRVVLPDGLVIAENYTFIQLSNVRPPGPALNLSVTPTSGSAPLFFNVTAQLNVSVNNTATFELDLYASTGGVVEWKNGTPDDWLGHPLTIMGMLPVAGVYLLTAQVYGNVSGVWGWVSTANASLTVVAAVGPPSLSFSAMPGAGAAPLNVTLSFVAAGGSAPFSLSVCSEGPFATTNTSGPCSSIGSTPGWNGSAFALQTTFTSVGNYTIYATVSESSGANSTAFAPVAVTPSGPVAPLTAHASYTAPTGVSTSGATYAFVTSVSGGVAPYTIQWSFGDGALGSALPGSTVLHTYTMSGSYTATLTVTDARGTQARSSVGPLIVALPLGPVGTAPWWALGWVLAVATVLAVASAVVLAVTVDRLARRKEALNWFQKLEERRDSTESAPRSR